MSTHSFIHVERVLMTLESPNRWARIYCHSDGYWEHNGLRLHTFYNSQELAEQLVALGDISYLGEEIGEKHAFGFRDLFRRKHASAPNATEAMYSDPEFIRLERMCQVYGRDRNDAGTEAWRGPTLERVFTVAAYMYVWRDGMWWGTDARFKSEEDPAPYIASLRPLADILSEEGLLTSMWPENIRRRARYIPPPKRALLL
ncbi:hypothetical protein J2J97_32035 (plasmid) [Rhizobium bangladeshense]|uniref:hypothetical protein n=1 Tax=Rhizobium bangladeshense TaxID=1138189 RepID=UPI001A98118C|nr:hypothetical protein [Rhizobium bangladeshense]QSY98537.1 hypothetical protein J2J97_32035 [Rhizobium bangladeshense]